jgi:uncharacterized protein YjbI with pentapeptide repeats
MKENIEPFEQREIDGKMILWLHGTKDQCIVVEKDKVQIILDAILEEWDIDIDYAIIKDGINADFGLGKFTFCGIMSLTNSKIEGTSFFGRFTFDEEVNFSGTYFKNVDFRNVYFRKKANFYESKFGKAFFREACFEELAYFYKAIFLEQADFMEAQFNKNAEFVCAQFHIKKETEMNFIRARFKGRAEFIRNIFRVADFRESIFEDEAEFRNSKFGEKALFWKAKAKYPASFNDIEFQENTVIRGLWNDVIRPICWWTIYYLPPCSVVFRIFERLLIKFLFTIKLTFQHDIGSIFDELKSKFKNRNLPILTNCQTEKKGKRWFISDIDKRKYIIVKRMNRLYVYQEKDCISSYLLQKIKSICNIWKKVRDCRIPVTDFSRFNTSTVMDGASNPWLKRYIDDELWIKSWKDRNQKTWWKRPLFFVWELTSHCGRSFSLWMFWSLILALIFGFLYKGHINIDSCTANNWYTPFYFSVVTFTTLGFGDVKPADWVGQLWITLEVLSGYLMLGGLLSIFSNKFARRS